MPLEQIEWTFRCIEPYDRALGLEFHERFMDPKKSLETALVHLKWVL